MGNAESTSYALKEEFHKLSKQSSFSFAQIERLYERFKQLDRDSKGFLEHQDLISIRGLMMNPLAERFIQLLFDTSDSERVSFNHFVRFLAIFRPIRKSLPIEERREALRQKIWLLFKIYDLDNENKIGDQQLIAIFKLMLGDALRTEKAAEMATEILQEVDQNGDSQIEFNEFYKTVRKMEVDQKLTINFMN